MDKLILMDQISYVRFASVYKHFDDVETFIHEIEQMERKKNNEQWNCRWSSFDGAGVPHD